VYHGCPVYVRLGIVEQTISKTVMTSRKFTNKLIFCALSVLCIIGYVVISRHSFWTRYSIELPDKSGQAVLDVRAVHSPEYQYRLRGKYKGHTFAVEPSMQTGGAKLSLAWVHVANKPFIVVMHDLERCSGPSREVLNLETGILSNKYLPESSLIENVLYSQGSLLGYLDEK
jgi:hypothetical protein